MMDRINRVRVPILCAFAISFGGFASAMALEIVAESFDYTTASSLSLTGQNGGTGWSGAWASHTATFGNLTVVTGGSLSYTGVVTAGNRISLSADGDATRSLPARSDTFGDTVWVSFLARFTAAGGGFNNVRLYDGSTHTGGIGGNNSYTNWTILDNTLSSTTFSSTAFSSSTTHLAMLKIDYAAGTSSLWMNPVLSTFNDSQTPSMTRSIAPVFDKIAIYMRSGTQIDEFRIATTWQESVGQAAPVPEPSTWVLATAACMTLQLARQCSRRRKLAWPDSGNQSAG